MLWHVYAGDQWAEVEFRGNGGFGPVNIVFEPTTTVLPVVYRHRAVNCDAYCPSPATGPVKQAQADYGNGSW